jgi:uncharacterized protein (DUF924 family)/Ca2+-binding EF-hand superfamily protein
MSHLERPASETSMLLPMLLADTDGDKKISKEEFRVTCKLIFHDITDEELLELFDELDTDKSGDVNLSELTFLFKLARGKGEGLQSGLKALANLHKVFDVIDRDNSGSIEMAEFITAMRLFSCKLADSDLEKIFKDSDTDNSGFMCYSEFIKIVSRSSECRQIVLRVLSSEDMLNTTRQSIERASSTLDPLAHKILLYWFPPTMQDCLLLWFGKDVDTDDYITAEFGAAVVDARDGKMNHWLNSELETLALLILLDQFSRNVFRHSPDTFSCDDMALAVVTRSLFYDYHKKVSKLASVFFCLVLTHSENIHHQELCVELWEDISHALSADDPCHKFDPIFTKHLHVIKRFGRFPHRNEVLGRTTTHVEEEFLNDPSYRFDLPMKSDGTGFTDTSSFVERKEGKKL